MTWRRESGRTRDHRHPVPRTAVGPAGYPVGLLLCPHGLGALMTSALTDKGSTWAWRKKRKRILIRDNHTCQYCGAPANTVDHKLPRRMGGGDEDSNLVACCSSCQHGGDRTTHIGRPMSIGGARGGTGFLRGAADRHAPVAPLHTQNRGSGVVRRDYTAPDRAGATQSRVGVDRGDR